MLFLKPKSREKAKKWCTHFIAGVTGPRKVEWFAQKHIATSGKFKHWTALSSLFSHQPQDKRERVKVLLNRVGNRGPEKSKNLPSIKQSVPVLRLRPSSPSPGPSPRMPTLQGLLRTALRPRSSSLVDVTYLPLGVKIRCDLVSIRITWL